MKSKDKPFRQEITITLWTTPIDLQRAADCLDYQWERYQRDGGPEPEFTWLCDQVNITLRIKGVQAYAPEKK